MPLKGKGQRARTCPAVVINIKEPLVVVQGWNGGEASRVAFWQRCTGYVRGYSLILVSGCCEGPGPPHTGPIDRPSCRLLLSLPQSVDTCLNQRGLCP